MRKLITRTLMLVGLGGAGFVASRALGSRPEPVTGDAPIPACPDNPNCYRARRTFGADSHDVFNAAEAAVRGYTGLMGRAETVHKDGLALDAVFAIGPLKDDLKIVVQQTDALGSTVFVRSAARTGRSDLGVNRMRANALLADIGQRLGRS